MVPRACLAVVAVLAAAWLALSLRNDQLAMDGLKTSVVTSTTPSPGTERDRVRRSIRKLNDARLLNPDKTPAVYEALVQSALDREAAARKLSELSQSYPNDSFVWAAILRVVLPSDPRAAEARAHLRALIPQRPR